MPHRLAIQELAVVRLERDAKTNASKGEKGADKQRRAELVFVVGEIMHKQFGVKQA